MGARTYVRGHDGYVGIEGRRNRMSLCIRRTRKWGLAVALEHLLSQGRPPFSPSLYSFPTLSAPRRCSTTYAYAARYHATYIYILDVILYSLFHRIAIDPHNPENIRANDEIYIIYSVREIAMRKRERQIVNQNGGTTANI